MVPSIPMKSEQRPVEIISRGRLPATFRRRVARLVPNTCNKGQRCQHTEHHIQISTFNNR